MGLASQVAKAGAKKAGKSSTSITDLVKAKKAKEITPQDITEYIKTTLIPKKESDENFKSKFKDTTVVDEKNKPRVMYHGRNKDFESFDTANAKTDTQEIGTHIGTADQANEFATREGGNVVPAYLDVKNPLRLNDYGGFHSGEVLEQLRSRGGFDEDLLDEIEDIPSIVERNKAVVDLIKGSGYDGIVYLNKREGLNLKGTEKQKSEKIDELQDYDDETLKKKYGAKDSYIIFDPAQAKSIFNKGSWSGSDDRLNYNKGGTVKDMNTLFAEGGMNDQGGTVDPVSGNDVPPGSLQNEVRDDIDAKLSEGEFVIPADVVRYIGLERLMKLRDEAKQGLSRMNEIGQMGNAQEVANPEALHEDDGGFTSEVDDIMEEVDMDSRGEKRFAAGGFAEPGTDYLAKYNIPKTSITNPALDVRAYKNAEGRVMYITFFNDKPSIAIPAGYEFAGTANQFLAEVKKTDDKKDSVVTATETIESGGDGPTGPAGGPAVGTGSGVGGPSGTSIGNSPIGIAIGAIANAISSITNPNAPISNVPDVSLTAIGNTGATAEGLATTAAALGIDDASISEGVSEGNSSNGAPGTVGSTDATAAADNSGNTNSVDGGGGSGSTGSDGGGAGAGTGNAMAKGGLVAKRTKKPTLAQKRGIASKK